MPFQPGRGLTFGIWEALELIRVQTSVHCWLVSRIEIELTLRGH